MVVGYLDIQMQAEAQPLPHTQKLTQNGSVTEIKAKSTKLLGKKHRASQPWIWQDS